MQNSAPLRKSVGAKFLFSPHGGGHFPPMVRGKFLRFSPHGGGFSSDFEVSGGTRKLVEKPTTMGGKFSLHHGGKIIEAIWDTSQKLNFRENLSHIWSILINIVRFEWKYHL